MFRREKPFFLPQCRSIRPEEKKGVCQEKIGITTQNAEAGIDQVIGEIVGVSDDPVYSSVTEHHVAHKNTFRNHMQKATDGDQKKTDHHVRKAHATKQGRGERTKDDYIS
jgi:hypothetical protein